MDLFILYKYYNYGMLNEKQEVMCAGTDKALALRLADKYGWTIGYVPANKIRVAGGPLSCDRWVTEKDLVTYERKLPTQTLEVGKLADEILKGRK